MTLTKRGNSFKISSVPGCLQGYRSIWHTLQLKGIRKPHVAVQQFLKESDPEGTKM